MIPMEDISAPTMENLDRRLTMIKAASFRAQRWGDTVFATLILQNGERYGSPGDTNVEAIDRVFQLYMEHSSCPSA